MGANPHAKHAKGFKVLLSGTHWFLIQQSHAWLKSLGRTTPEMDEAAALMPHIKISDKEYAQAVEHGAWGDHNWGAGKILRRSTTIRFRAAEVKGAINLLRLVAAFFVGGQLGGTLRRRADALAEVSAIDLMVDASR